GWIVETLCATLQMVVIIGAIYAVKHHVIDVAIFLLFQVYALRIIDNIRQSSFMVRQLEAVSGDAQEMTELMEEIPEVLDPVKPKPSHISAGVIELQKITSQYADATSREKLFEN